jgi:hypothetical protein
MGRHIRGRREPAFFVCLDLCELVSCPIPPVRSECVVDCLTVVFKRRQGLGFEWNPNRLGYNVPIVPVRFGCIWLEQDRRHQVQTDTSSVTDNTERQVMTQTRIQFPKCFGSGPLCSHKLKPQSFSVRTVALNRGSSRFTVLPPIDQLPV